MAMDDNSEFHSEETTANEDDLPEDEILSDEERINVMITALQSHQLIVRTTAVNQLVELGKKLPDKAIPELVKSLGSDYWSVRFGAAEALGEIGNPEVVPDLIEYLEKDEDPEFRAMIAKQLGLIGDKRAVKPLIKRVQSDSNAEVREFACQALGRLADDAAESTIRDALKDSSNLVRREAALALGKIGKKESVSALIDALNDADPKVRENAAASLGMIKDPRAIRPLIEALKDGSVNVHKKAKEALEQFDPSVIFEVMSKEFDGNIYLILGKIREASLSVGDEGALSKLYKEKAAPIVDPLREKARRLLNELNEMNESGRQALEQFKKLARQVDKLTKLSPEELGLHQEKLNTIYSQLTTLQKDIQKNLDTLAEISLYEFTKHEWIKNELFFELQSIEREIDDIGGRLRNLRELIEAKKMAINELKAKIDMNN